MLLSHPQKRDQDPPPLDTAEQIDLAGRREAVLHLRARRQREETAARRDDFELIKDKIVFGIWLAASAVVLVGMVIAMTAKSELMIPIAFLGRGVFRNLTRS